MRRRVERRILTIGGIWNIITGVITMFGYSAWYQTQGIGSYETEQVVELLESGISEQINSIIMIFGLLVFAAGITGILVAKAISDNKIQKKVMAWMIVWGVLQLLSYDTIGFAIYSIAFVLYISKNKAIKLMRQQEEQLAHQPA